MGGEEVRRAGETWGGADGARQEEASPPGQFLAAPPPKEVKSQRGPNLCFSGQVPVRTVLF